MPIKKSAKKALRQAKTRRERNLKRKGDIKDLTKKIIKAITDNKIDQLNDLLKQAQKAIDKAAKRNVIKKNNANRKKSRLAARVNKALKK